MKNQLILLLLLVVSTNITFADGSTNISTDFTIGLSPFLSTTESERVERRVKVFVLDAPRGSRIRCDDGFNLQSIVSFTLRDSQFDSPATRMRTFKDSFVRLSKWFRESRANSVSAELTNSGSLRIPEYLDFVASGAVGASRKVILIGSPLARYPTEPSLSMIGFGDEPRVPSDGHLLASLQASPYGTAERRGRLKGSLVSWCYTSENVWSNTLQKTLVTRFWFLFTKQLDATMVAFTPDLQSAFTTPSGPAGLAVGSFDIDPQDTKIEMRLARPRQVPTWLPQLITQTNSSSATSVVAPQTPAIKAERPIGVTPPAPAVVPTGSTLTRAKDVSTSSHELPSARAVPRRIDSPVELGIAWESMDTSLDLDLYVKPSTTAAELSFKNVRTPQGQYVYDWRQPNSQRDYEWVRLSPPVQTDQIEVWVNLFRGRGPIRGTVAVHFANKVYSGTFHLACDQGNRGINAEHRDGDPHWARLDITRILELK
jgi:hypothetical protein